MYLHLSDGAPQMRSERSRKELLLDEATVGRLFTQPIARLGELFVTTCCGKQRNEIEGRLKDGVAAATLQMVPDQRGDGVPVAWQVILKVTLE